MYARLRGVPASEIRNTVDGLIQRIDLSEYADRCSTFLRYFSKNPLIDRHIESQAVLVAS